MAPYCVREDTEHLSVMSYMGDVEEGSTGSSAAEEEEEEVEQLAGVFPPPPNVLPESLSLENSLPQLLMSQCGVSEEYELVNQTNIRLRIISKDMSLQRLSIYMPSLVELDLTGSWLQSLRDLGCGLRLRILKVSRCGLDCLDGLFGLSTLTELHAQSNLITDIGSCAVLPRLQLLDLSRNRVETLGEISFLSICYQLSNLNLSYNPVSAYPEYREVVTTLLPGLHVLDGEILAVDVEKNKEDIDDESTEISEKNPNQNGNLQKENIDEGSKDEEASRKSPSVVESENNRGSTGDSSKVKKRARPSTSIGFHPSIKATGRLERPHTAGPNRKPQNQIDEDVTSDFPDIDGTEESSTSLLTSGGIVCGNLTAALRSRTRNRNQRESWGHDQINRSSSPSSNFNNTTSINNSNDSRNILSESMENNNLIKPDIKEKEERAKEIESLLKASRNWRAAYSSYRETNREKWEKDDDGIEEDEENCKQIN